ncbi:MAG: hypothetical protein JNK64_31200 [Myxococcales bacterium]|nr:hypothetical protein [Myxococcales bacterium]
MFKVLCPIERKDGSTHWLRIGSGFPNKDQSVNIYLDVLPVNLKLQLRELDEEDLQPRAKRASAAGGDAPNRQGEALPF